VLGLVIVVTIVSNIVLWSYEMNNLDWERMKEDINIASATAVNGSGSYNPLGYILGGSTSWVSGSVSDLTSDNGAYMTFRSYYSGDVWDFVDNNISDVDSSSDQGAHSDFSAQQVGPDSVSDTLTEVDTGGTKTMELWVDNYDGSKGDWTEIGTTPYLSSINFPTDYIYTDITGGTEEHFDFANPSVTGTINDVTICVYGRNEPGDNGKLEIHLYNSTGRYFIADPVLSDNAWGWYNYSCLSILPTWTEVDDAKLRVVNIKVGGADTLYVDAALISVNYTDVNYDLDLEVQWTSINYGESSEELCIYGGAIGAESIKVDVRNESEWQNLLTDLSSGWNNVSVSTYLVSSTFTIRFKGGMETTDATQDSWGIDATLLHVWSEEYTMEVEFTGSSNMENWIQLNWTVNSAWSNSSVSVTLQLYNYNLGSYPTTGNGYLTYTSNATPDTDENQSQMITINPTHFRNATGFWKIKITGVKATGSQYNFKADWVEFEVEASGTRFTFENEEPLTVHLVSLWIIDSTNHQRYDISVFVNAAETKNYTRPDISLPTIPYTVKVVTERGNIAVYTES
jgi:hypothetical protein